jgi:hypothetical protein
VTHAEHTSAVAASLMLAGKKCDRQFEVSRRREHVPGAHLAAAVARLALEGPRA